MANHAGKSFVLSSTAAVLAIVILLLLSGEALLRRSEKFASYWEKNGLPTPESTVEATSEPWLWLHSKNQQWVLKKDEFDEKYSTNSEGLPGNLLPLEKSKNDFRILAVGDSFTEGAGDTEGLGYVGRLERLLAKRKDRRNIQVMNAGVSGSDPVFGVELIRRKLLKYKPDLVLLTINGSDLADFRRRGGLERFTPEGLLKKRPPAWAWAFNHCHLLRAVLIGWFHYNWELQSQAANLDASKIAVSELIRTSELASQSAAENGFKLLILIQPVWTEIRDRSLRGWLVDVENGLRMKHVDFADLLPDFLARIPGQISADYYWPRDGHFKPKGYQVFAESVEAELNKRGLLTLHPKGN